MTPSDAYEGNTYQGGANVMHILRWAVALAADAARQRVARGERVPAEWAPDLDYNTALSHLPLRDHPAYEELAPFWPRWISQPTDGPYWRSISPNAAYEKVTVPVLNIGGWYDIMLGPALENYRGVRHGGGSGLAAQSRLIIGPWSHTDLTGSFPDREFGPTASRQAIDLDGLQLRWFDRWVKGIENGIEDEDPVLIFVMGADSGGPSQTGHCRTLPTPTISCTATVMPTPGAATAPSPPLRPRAGRPTPSCTTHTSRYRLSAARS